MRGWRLISGLGSCASTFRPHFLCWNSAWEAMPWSHIHGQSRATSAWKSWPLTHNCPVPALLYALSLPASPSFKVRDPSMHSSAHCFLGMPFRIPLHIKAGCVGFMVSFKEYTHLNTRSYLNKFEASRRGCTDGRKEEPRRPVSCSPWADLQHSSLASPRTAESHAKLYCM